MNSKEIEQRSGLTRANIRYYEQEGLLAPARQENKYRDYSEADLETLLRIVLLRSLGFSIDEIRRLQRGEEDFTAAMRSRCAALGAESERLLAAQSVCDTISRDVESYSALRAEVYLSVLSDARTAKETDIPEVHPWRRFFAREIDAALCGLPVSFVLYVIFNSVPNGSTGIKFLIGLAGWLVILFVEPLLLSRYATTFGKWCMGITVTRPDGEKLTYREALDRTALVFFAGEGMNVPLVQIGLNIWNYYKYTHGRELAWEDGSVEHFAPRGGGRMALSYLGSEAVFIMLSVLMLLSTYLPPCRGALTVAEFAENVNYYREHFDLSERWRMDENGGWVEDQQNNVIYFGTSAGQPSFTYETTSDGCLRAVRWDYAVRSDETVTLPLTELRMAAYALGAAQKEVNLFTVYHFSRFVTSDLWRADENYNQSKYGTEIRYRAYVGGDYYANGDVLFALDGDEPHVVDISFETRVS